ncbi:MAG: Methylase involved in ubiquinone/menaquinone biosynthesis-like protein [Parcubacteria group bacterium GW2011_GWA2_38_27]|nr:MAG: Methylase involved in ubiquinone/menaquinone biosynthesis-like protein [Parcubacteria group bacterium GW2011_GWA2_38_27]
MEGYVNIDFPPSEHTIIIPKADIFKDIRKLEYQENSVDEIRNHHLFEHFSRQEALKLLLQWRRWLKLGGLLVIETPDFEECAKLFITTNDIEKQFKLARHIFGSHEAEWALHKDFWSKSKFKFVLNKLGFSVSEIQQNRSYYRKDNSFIAKVVGKIAPESIKNLTGDILPNIIVRAEKDNRVIDEQKEIVSILLMSLVGGQKGLLDVWLKDIGY